MSTHALRFIAATAGCSTKDWFSYGNLAPLFEHDGEAKKAYEFMDKFARKHGRVPGLETITEHCGLKLPSTPGEPEWLAQKLRETRVRRKLALAGEELQALMKGDDPLAALAYMNDVATKLLQEVAPPNAVDFKHASAILWPWLQEKWSGSKMCVPFPWPTLDAMTGGVYGGEMISTVGRPEKGKAQPLHAKVLKADGTWEFMGDLQVGDKLASVDGRPSEVEAIHPQGELDIYRLTFVDGRQVEACGDHLWEVESSRWDGPRVVTTKALLAYQAGRIGRRMGVRLAIAPGQAEAPIDPWIIGLIIGDGCVVSNDVRLSIGNGHVRAEVERRLLDGYELRHDSEWDYRITHGQRGRENAYKAALLELGLWGALSINKRLPEVVYAWKPEHRLLLLQGIMDADGWGQDGAAILGTSSAQLALDVQRLAWSLGAIARLQKSKGRAWRVRITAHPTAPVFKLAYKLADALRRTPQPALQILRIEHVRREKAQCIQVSHPRRLYITDGYIPTHNTWQQLHIALHIWVTTKRPVVFASQEMMIRKVMERLAALYTKVAVDVMKDGIAGTKTKEVRLKLKKDLLALENTDLPPFIVTDGNLSATAKDIVMLCRQFQPAACFVDGAYLLRAPDGRPLRKHEAIDYNCESLKRDLATDLDLPVFASWQFNREGTKMKKDEEMGLEHIAGSDAIGQLSSIVLGMLDDVGETTADVENIARRRVRILKGRDGERGEFFTEWDFARMSFKEIRAKKDGGTDEVEAFYGV